MKAEPEAAEPQAAALSSEIYKGVGARGWTRVYRQQVSAHGLHNTRTPSGARSGIQVPGYRVYMITVVAVRILIADTCLAWRSTQWNGIQRRRPIVRSR